MQLLLRQMNLKARRALPRLARLLTRWIAGDVFYAVWPLVLLAAITAFLKESFDHFFEIKEWAFACIVFYGVALRKFVGLKMRGPQRLTPWQLDAGIPLFIAGLIASSMVLVFVVLEEKGVFRDRNVEYLGAVQITLFVTGLVSLLVCVCEEIGDQAEEDHQRTSSRA